ncbi:uncharacterized protein LOC127262740 isoform X2 [Andrographis paniculata]|uniref:uncharacterized protein LOC127262740 isoform X2 n=1 Tax=Andrographis paniculata TaxID=175694 RepID=UPI0021E799B2|nr:uncharacterized protein LOC127262740 isoform X2 [Andrographis paniculata]XP_051147503.1 uncharacterized protein LOC127262740 isoform X2 [Andrographis paniculata]
MELRLLQRHHHLRRRRRRQIVLLNLKRSLFFAAIGSSGRFYWLSISPLEHFAAYVLIRTRQRDTDSSESEIPESTSSATSSSSSSAIVEVSDTPPIVKETIRRAPIPEDQQRELFKWMLEEKRKVKPKDPEEKKRIDEEKAVLKQFIRAKSIPSL